MPHISKIATCCYCGTRAALVLGGSKRQELACSTCGAPLHELKMIRTDSQGARELVKSSPLRCSPRTDRQHRAPKSGKQTQSLGQRFMRELWDAVDDLLDDVLDVFD